MASKIELDYDNIEKTNYKMVKQLSLTKIETINIKYTPTIYHLEALYRDNTNDKYELFVDYID